LQLLQELELTSRTTGARLTLGSPYVFPPLPNTGERPKPVYIHSKLIVVDDLYLSIGSANLATRALRLDTEITLTLEAKTDAEKVHVSKFADRAIHHWNHEDVKLIPIHPMEEFSERIRGLSPFSRVLQKHVPWKLFFDPPLPWFYPLARTFRKSARHPRSTKRIGGILMFSIALALVSSAIAVLMEKTTEYAWTFVFSWIFNLAWLLPFPFTALAILASFKLGPQTGSLLAVLGLWCSSFIGYFLTRLFPATGERFFNRTIPSWLQRRLKLRSFATTLFAFADPRLGIRSKIAYSGLSCVPLPWFLFSMILLMPAGLYGLLRLIRHYAPVSLASEISRCAPALFLILSAFGVFQFVVRFARRRGIR
jgi:uncharacterized membrane protein YdjX (TVP38/TMEM64 family)